jgi:hypothetical protein
MPNSTKYWFESNFEFTCVIDFFSDFLNNFNTLISKIKKIILIYFQTKNIFKNQLFAACGKTSAIIGPKASMKLRAFPINACKVFGNCNYSSPESDNIQN